MLAEGKLGQAEAPLGQLLGVHGVSDVFLSISIKNSPPAVAPEN